MNLKKLAVLFICLAAAILLSAQTAQEHFMLGNTAYKNGDYQRAKESYLEAGKLSTDNPDLLFNLANTHAQLGEKSQAQLNYLRALYKNPRMREASANLDMLAKQHTLELPTKDGAATLLYELSEFEWTMFAFMAFWLIVIFVFIPPLYFKKSVAWSFMSIICAIIFVTAVFGVYNWRLYANTALAMKDDTPILSSPASKAPVIFHLNEGQIARILKSHGNFLYVRTSNGKEGWVDKNELERVVE